MNRKTLSRIVLLSLLVVMLATTAIGTGLSVAGVTPAESPFHFTAFDPAEGDEITVPAALACDGCSGGGGGPW
ncbi:MAG: hypothetical protein HN929_10315 [Chloroflexi bacterium]|jgi:hypothetical protein|nr:hypothetical protein [Chloroflexota bacterium]MBT7081843.1 hypothetical protein [Chloroflexota bacterium]